MDAVSDKQEDLITPGKMRVKVEQYHSEESCENIKNKIVSYMLSTVSKRAERGVYSSTFTRMHLENDFVFPPGKYYKIINMVVADLKAKSFSVEEKTDYDWNCFNSVTIDVRTQERIQEEKEKNSFLEQILLKTAWLTGYSSDS
jgi:hypothetical protein